MNFIKTLEKLHGDGPYHSWQIEDVLSKVKVYREDRSKMATQMLAGIISSGASVRYTNQTLAKEAVSFADTLIAALGDK